MSEKKYVNGLFIKEKSTQYGSLMNVSINVEGFKSELDSLQQNKGYVNLTFFKRKEADKYGNTHYAIVNEFKPETKTEPEVIQERSNDDLPF